MPPAVPAGDPPINVSSIDTNADASVIHSCAIDAKPAVLKVTELKNAFTNLSKRDK